MNRRSLRLPLPITLLLVIFTACTSAPPRLGSSDVGLLEARLGEQRSPGSVEDARKELGMFAGDAAWTGPARRRIVARLATEAELDLASLFEYPVKAERLLLTVEARLRPETVELVHSGQELPLAPGLGSAPGETGARVWLELTIVLDDSASVRVVQAELVPTPAVQGSIVALPAHRPSFQ